MNGAALRAKVGGRLHHADVALDPAEHDVIAACGPELIDPRREIKIARGAEGHLLDHCRAVGKPARDGIDGGAEALGVLLGDDHRDLKLPRRLDQDTRRAGHRVRIGDRGHEPLLHVDDDEGRAVPLQQGGASLPYHGA